MSENKSCPDLIYLQACDECYEEAMRNRYGSEGMVTWCYDYIGHECDAVDPKDVVYVRLSRLEGVVKELENRKNNVFESDDDWMKGILHGYTIAIQSIADAFPELEEQ